MKPRAPRPKDVTPEQLTVVPGSLPLDGALDALAEHLVALWLRRRGQVKTNDSKPASEAAPEGSPPVAFRARSR